MTREILDMHVHDVISALRDLAPACPGGEAVLLEAAEHLRQMEAKLAARDQPSLWVEADPQIPPPEPSSP